MYFAWELKRYESFLNMKVETESILLRTWTLEILYSPMSSPRGTINDEQSINLGIKISVWKEPQI